MSKNLLGMLALVVLTLGVVGFAAFGPAWGPESSREEQAVEPMRSMDTIDYSLLAAIHLEEATDRRSLSKLEATDTADLDARLARYVGNGLVLERRGQFATTEKGAVWIDRAQISIAERDYDFDMQPEVNRLADLELVRAPPVDTPPPGMVWIPGGVFVMGDGEGAPDKNPDHLDEIPEHNDARYEHAVALDGFWMDAHEVTNREFAEFVAATGYRTKAERGFSEEDFPGVAPKSFGKGDLDPGSICYNSTFDPSKVDKSQPGWPETSGIWKVQKGANWREPQGPGSSIEDIMDHPVVHVSWDDAVAYSEWAGKQLPTEAQWEYAARGGLEEQPYPWGDEFKPGGKWPHNIWQGNFPFENHFALGEGGDGFERTSPVGAFPANGYGLYDMTGNVWEWCADWYRPEAYAFAARRNPAGPNTSFDPRTPGVPKRVQRGGSFMCSDTYCIGYSVSSRMSGEPFTGTFHCGFRCVVPADGHQTYANAPARKAKVAAAAKANVATAVGSEREAE